MAWNQKKRVYIELLYLIIIVIMFRRSVVLWSLAVLSVGFSFADFQSELNKCEWMNGSVTECKQKAFNKYAITKQNACKYKDGLYQSPIQAKRPDRKVMTSHFYKYNNTLYYPVVTSYVNYAIMSNWDWIVTDNYLYSYDCSIKKAVDTYLSIWRGGLKLMQWKEDKVILWEYNKTSPQSWYRLLNVSENIQISEFSIKNNQDIIKKLKEVLDPYNKAEKNIRLKIWNIETSVWGTLYGMEEWVIISTINKDLVGTLSVVVNKYSRDPISKKRIDILSNKTITLGTINLITNTISLN
jgi:hypothetical protein